MPSVDPRYSPYSTVHRSIDSMLSRLTHRNSKPPSSSESPTIRRSVPVKLRRGPSNHYVASQSTTSKKASLRTVLRRIADGIAFGAGPDTAIDCKTKARQREKRTQHHPRQAVEDREVPPAESLSTTANEEHHAVPASTHSFGVQTVCSSINAFELSFHTIKYQVIPAESTVR